MTRICVIGAGMSGISAAKLALSEGYQVTVYEKAAELGGTWVFDEDVNGHSSMYEVMQTNAAKETMIFRDLPMDAHLPSFPGHQDVLRHLQKYADGIPVHYSTTVDSVSRNNGLWKVDTTRDGIPSSQLFDVVFVCNGHLFDPKMTVDTSKFTGRVLHSHSYRRAGDYRNQTVAVVGAGPSGVDIAKQICLTATKTHLIGRKAVYHGIPETMQQYTSNVRELTGSSVILKDGTTIGNVDTVIMSTGYRYKFPFLDSSLVQLKYDGHLVSPLWEHVCHVDHPRSLFFVGLNNIVMTPTLMEQQVLFALSVIGGRARLPSDREMRDWEAERLRELPSLGMTAQDFHTLSNAQWEYYDHLADIGNFPRWSYHKLMKKIRDFTHASRDQNVWDYKQKNFILNETLDDFRLAEATEPVKPLAKL